MDHEKGQHTSLEHLLREPSRRATKPLGGHNSVPVLPGRPAGNPTGRQRKWITSRSKQQTVIRALMAILGDSDDGHCRLCCEPILSCLLLLRFFLPWCILCARIPFLPSLPFLWSIAVSLYMLIDAQIMRFVVFEGDGGQSVLAACWGLNPSIRGGQL